jgi:hypothetical protein
VETAENQIAINTLAVGTRLVVQCKKDWRMAVVSFVSEEKIVLQICSPSGRTYRKSCDIETLIDSTGAIPFLGEGVWQENLVKYDSRW